MRQFLQRALRRGIRPFNRRFKRGRFSSLQRVKSRNQITGRTSQRRRYVVLERSMSRIVALVSIVLALAGCATAPAPKTALPVTPPQDVAASPIVRAPVA